MKLSVTPLEYRMLLEGVRGLLNRHDIGFLFRCIDAKNVALDEWKALLEVAMSAVVFPGDRRLTDEEDCAVAFFVEERLGVLTCGGLFDARPRAVSTRPTVQ